MTRNGVSMSSTKQFTVGTKKAADLFGTPWNPRSQKGMSNSKSSYHHRAWSQSSTILFTKTLNSLLISLCLSLSCCSSSISSGSIIDLLFPPRDWTTSITCSHPNMTFVTTNLPHQSKKWVNNSKWPPW